MAQLVDQWGRPITTGALRAGRARALYTPTARDRYYSYPRRGITPAKLAAILREADEGYPARQVELFRDVEEVDAHLASQLQTRKAAVLGLEYEIHPDGDDARAERAAELGREVLLGLEDLDDLLRNLMDAVPQGWALSELVWDVSSGQAVITGHRDIPQERSIWTEPGPPRLATDQEPVRGIELPPGRVVYHQHRARKVAPVRAGVLRTVVWWWLFKNFSVKDWTAFAEVFGMPLRLGKYQPSASPEDRDALKQALYALGTDGAAIISQGTEIEFVGSKVTGAGQLVYERLCEFCDRAISKAVLGQTLTSDVGKVGSYAAAKVHQDVRQDLRDDDAWALAKTIRQQILRPLTALNFGSDCPVPWFRFQTSGEEDLKERQEIYAGLLDMGLPIPRAHVYELFGVPTPEPGDEVLERGSGAVVQPNRVPVTVVANAAAPGTAGSVQEAIEHLVAASLERAASAAEDLGRRLIRAARDTGDYLPAMQAAMHAWLDGRDDRLARPLMEAALVAHLDGRLGVLDEEHTGAPVVQPNRAEFLLQPVQPVEAIKYFRAKLPLTPEQFARLEGDYKAMAFTVAGVAEEDMLAAMFSEIKGALRRGTGFDRFRRGVDDLFQRAGFAGPRPWHLETVFLNQVQGAYMAGRYQQMRDLADLRPYWQYTAVMDRRTRPAHAAQHGKVYPADHPYWDTWYPPNGHRCRCDVISLSEDEVRARGLQVEQEMPRGLEPDRGWDHNVGVAGWGRGMVKAVLAGRRPGWQPLPELDAISDPAGPLPDPTPLPELPEPYHDVLRSMSPKEAQHYYRDAAIKALGLERGPDGRIKDLPIVDAAGDRGVLSARAIDHALPEKDLARGRYLGLARAVIEDADEIWLVPGQYPNGRVAFRRRYIKVFRSDDSDRPMLALAEVTRGVWEAFNVFPLAKRKLEGQRKGLLRFRAAPRGSR